MEQSPLDKLKTSIATIRTKEDCVNVVAILKELESAGFGIDDYVSSFREQRKQWQETLVMHMQRWNTASGKKGLDIRSTEQHKEWLQQFMWLCNAIYSE